MMDIFVIPNSSTPAYRQLYEQISAQILTGKLRAGDALPPVRTVSSELGISIITVRSAWEALEKDGFIITRTGSGCYIADIPEPQRNEIKAALLRERIRSLVKASKSIDYSESDLLKDIHDAFKDEK